jgi:hypothetical protein
MSKKSVSAYTTIVLHILIVTFLDRRQDRFWTEWQQAFPEFNQLLIYSWILFYLLPLILNIQTLPYF